MFYPTKYKEGYRISDLYTVYLYMGGHKLGKIFLEET